MNIEKKLKELVEMVDAQSVTVTITYDKDPHRASSRLATENDHPYEVEIEWRDGTSVHVRIGDKKATNLNAALNATEAELKGYLVRERMTEGET